MATGFLLRELNRKIGCKECALYNGACKKLIYPNVIFNTIGIVCIPKMIIVYLPNIPLKQRRF